MQNDFALSKQDIPGLIDTLCLESLQYDDIHGIRSTIEGWLKNQGASQPARDRLLLSASEVLSNLISHPPAPASFIRISMAATGTTLTLDIADNSATFADFDAKCEESLNRVRRRALSASGRGLAIISLQHAERRYIPASQSPDGLNHFYIPETAQPPQLVKNPSPEIPEKSGRKKIFIVDDDEDIRDLVSLTLKNEAAIITFSDAEKALGAFLAEKPDLIISDLHMPGMNGLELRQALSAFDAGDATPFVFLSGNRMAAESTYINEMGIDDFLTKPVQKERLRNVVRRLLLRSSQIRRGVQSTFGKDVSEMLRPSLPQWLNGWKTVVKNHSAEIGGGDFIFHHSTDKDSVIVLADVMGKGLPAKFFACAYAGYLRSLFQIFRDTRAPDALLNRLSQAVGADPFLEATTLTCLVLRLTSNGDAYVSAAGHPAPLMVTRAAAEYMAVAGPLPGLGGNCSYQEEHKKLLPGDRLILFTDGLIESRSDPASFNLAKAHLLETALDCRRRRVEDLTEKIWKNFPRLHEQNCFEDDTTLIAFEYQGEQK